MFFLTFYLSKTYHASHIDNNNKCRAANHYIRMISEGSCDTED